MIVAAVVSAGIVADRQWGISVLLWWLLSLAACAVWVVLWRRRNRAAGLALLLALAACGGAWHHCRWHLSRDDDLGFCARSEQQPVCLEATAVSGTRRQPQPPPSPFRVIPVGDRTRLEVRLTRVRDGSTWRKATGRARLLITGELTGVHGGDRLLVFCRFNALAPAGNPGEFDYADYARADGRRSELHAERPACVSVIRRAAWFLPTRWLDAAQSAGERILWRHLDPRRAGLASAVLLGLREEVTADETEAFMETGLIHILSLAGMHVAFLSGTLFFLVRSLPLPRWVVVLIVVGVTIFYTVLTVAEPPAVRATALLAIVSIGWCLGRRRLLFNSLAAAGLVVLVLNPCDLFRVGTQLTFICVAAFMWFSSRASYRRRELDPLKRLIEESRPRAVRAAPRRGLALGNDGAGRGDLALGGSVGHGPIPPDLADRAGGEYACVAGHDRSPLVRPGAARLRRGVSAPCARAGLELRQEPGFVGMGRRGSAKLSGKLFLGARAVGLVAGGLLWRPRALGGDPSYPTPAALVPGAGGALVGGRDGSERDRASWAAGVYLSLGRPRLCNAARTADGREDALRRRPPLLARREHAGDRRALWSKGITHLDAVVLSHADADHFNALPGLLDRFSVGVVYVSPVMFDDRTETLDALEAAIRRAKVPIRQISAGDQLRGGPECTIEVIHPPRKGVAGSENANSIVLAVEYQGRRILLTGDLEGIGLNDVLAEEPWHCDVLLAPHHGSRQSDPRRLAAWTKPHWLVVSGGHRIDLEPARTAYGAVGSRILHTAETGAVRATVDSGGIQVTPFLKKNGLESRVGQDREVSDGPP